MKRAEKASRVQFSPAGALAFLILAGGLAARLVVPGHWWVGPLALVALCVFTASEFRRLERGQR